MEGEDEEEVGGRDGEEEGWVVVMLRDDGVSELGEWVAGWRGVSGKNI